MNTKASVFLLLVATSFLFGFSLSVQAQSIESDGNSAEQAGNLREALKDYVAALQGVPDGSEADPRLREKIIRVVQKMKPVIPDVPDEVIDHEGRAEAAVKTATKKDDFLDAAAEYRKGLRLAPWLARDYFNLGLVLEKTGAFDEAIRSFRLYLLAAPDGQDTGEVRKKIAGLQYEIEKSAKEKAEAEQQQSDKVHKEAAAQQEEQQRRQQATRALEGIWRSKSGRVWTVTMSEDFFEARSTPGWPAKGTIVLHGTVHDSLIEGTLAMPDVYDEESSCTLPTSEMPMKGTISEDQKQISFRAQQIIYYRNWNRGGLLVPKTCTSVTRDHIEELTFLFVR
jgi:tetratricopeptide (TPR) repeat protein